MTETQSPAERELRRDLAGTSAGLTAARKTIAELLAALIACVEDGFLAGDVLNMATRAIAKAKGETSTEGTPANFPP